MPELNELYDLEIKEISIVGGLGKAGPAVQDSKILVIKSEDGDEKMVDALTDVKYSNYIVDEKEIFPEDDKVFVNETDALTIDDLSDQGREKVAKASFKHFLAGLVGRTVGKEDEGDEEVEKAKDFNEVAGERNVMSTIGKHFDILMETLHGLFHDPDVKDPMADAEKAVKQFSASLLKSLKEIKSGKVSKETLKEEIDDYVEKAGAVISKKNLAELKKILAIISSLIAQVERGGVSKEGGTGEMEEIKKEIDGVSYVSKDGGQTFAKMEEEENPTDGEDAVTEEEPTDDEKTSDDNIQEIMKEREQFKEEIVKAVSATLEDKLQAELKPIKEKVESLEKKLNDSETSSAEVRKDVEALMRLSGSSKSGDQEPVTKSEDDEESFVAPLGLDGSIYGR
jgi:hypothetical protein